MGTDVSKDTQISTQGTIAREHNTSAADLGEDSLDVGVASSSTNINASPGSTDTILCLDSQERANTGAKGPSLLETLKRTKNLNQPSSSTIIVPHIAHLKIQNEEKCSIVDESNDQNTNLQPLTNEINEMKQLMVLILHPTKKSTIPFLLPSNFFSF